MRVEWICAWALGLSCVWGCGSGDGKRGAAGDGGTGDDGGTVVRDAGSVDAGQDGGGDASQAVSESAVVGRILDVSGRELGGIAVEVGGRKVRTDNRGVFRVADLPKGKHQVAVVDPQHTGAQVSVDVAQKETAQVSLRVMKLKSVALADAEMGGTIAQDDVEVTVPAGGLKTKEGAAVTGKVEARYAVVNTVDTVAAAPGGMKGELDSEDVDLESFGMVDMRFYQGDEELALADSADLVFPLGPNSFAQDEEIDMWSFNKSQGKWQREGKGRVDRTSGNGRVRVKASHFSWWNADQPLADKSCLRGQLLTEEGDPVTNMRIDVTGVDYLTNLSATTGSDGSFCVTVKRGSTNRLTAFGTDGSAYFEWDTPAAVAGSEATTCDLGGCTDVGTVMGAALFPECTGNVTSDDNHVLLLSSGDAVLDGQIQAHLENYGNQVTIGPEYVAFDDAVSLAGYDVVYLQANNNWNSGDMPVEGQRKLINWINCGGGMITVEWTVWKIGSGAFQWLDSVYPMVPVTPYGSLAQATYIQVGSDATIHNGLPSMFSFATDNYAGTEIDLTARPGATVFYDSQDRVEGVVGWDFNLGRVVSISTCGGPNEIADPNYGRMIANVVDWLQRDQPNEPSQTDAGADAGSSPDAGMDAGLSPDAGL